MDACDISPSVPDVGDFFGISEEFVAITNLEQCVPFTDKTRNKTVLSYQFGNSVFH